MKNIYPLHSFVILAIAVAGITMGYSQRTQHAFKPGINKKSLQSISSTQQRRLRQVRKNHTLLTQHSPQQGIPFPVQGAYQQMRSPRVILDRKTDMPILIETQDFVVSRNKLTTRAAVSGAASQFLQNIDQWLPHQSPQDEFELKMYETDHLGHTHVRMQQHLKGIPVVGSEMMIHFRPDGRTMMNGRLSQTPRLKNLEARLTLLEAEEIAQRNVATRVKVLEFNERQLELLQYDGPESRLVIYHDPDKPTVHRLAYEVALRPNVKDHWYYYIDAQNGEILNARNHTCSLMPPVNATGTDLNGDQQQVVVFQSGANQFLLVDNTQSMFRGQTNSPRNGDGLIITFDHVDDINSREISPVISQNNQWAPRAISAHNNAVLCYRYYENTFGRISIDGAGKDVQSFINVPDEENRPMDNAYWNGIGIYYGNGDVAFRPLAGALDVAAHEMTHGVISATANLIYQDESGALNESFADVFGVLIERRNFLIGEDVVNPQVFQSGALRNVADPHNGGTSLNDPGFQPRHVDEQYTGTEDNGGVHINSGIPNRAFALILESLGLNETGLQKTEQIYYRALTQYLLSSSEFVDCRLAVEQAAADLYGQQEVAAVRAAFDQVGILDPSEGGKQQNDPFEDLEVNPGRELMMVVNTDVSDPNKIYIFDQSAPQGTSPFIPISTRDPLRPVSISDDGSTGVFVSSDNFLYLLTDLDTGFPQESFLENNSVWSEAYWDNAAISKDGTKVAAVSIFQDTAIYVYDIPTRRGVFYELYNPTTAQGVIAGDVLYADALEWDFSGEFIMYDAYNLVSSTEEFFEAYWDIGFLRVWDNETENFGDGLIFKLFSNIPEGVSIGNPVFSKNSPYIIAFDQLIENDLEDFTDDEFSILLRNLENGDMNIFDNTTIGFPTFSPDDSRLAFTVMDEFEVEGVSFIEIAEDKITPVGGIQPLLIEARFPTWYSNGVRSLSVDRGADLADGSSWSAFPNPFQSSLEVELQLQQTASVELSLYNMMGQAIQVSGFKGQKPAGTHRIELLTESLDPGLYILSLKINNRLYHQKIIRQ